MAPSDRRQSYRLELEPGRAAITLPSGQNVSLSDLSPEGSGLILRGQALESDAVAVTLSLEGQQPFRADLEVVRSAAAEPGVLQLGTRFGSLSSDGLHALARFFSGESYRRNSDPGRLLTDSQTIRVTNLAFILNLFAHARGNRALFVVDGGVRLPCSLQIRGTLFHDGRRVIRAKFSADPSRLVPGRPYTLIFSGAGAATVFESTCVQQRGNEVLLDLPKEVRQTGFRESPRFPLESADVAGVQFAHPRLAGALLNAPVSDIAGRGLSFVVDPRSHALFAGDRIDAVRIRTPDGVVECSAVIRNVIGRDSESASCGVQLTEFGDRRDSERWHHFVFGRMHPRLSEGVGLQVEKSWKVLEASRYVGLWTPSAAKAHVRDCFVRAWQSPSATTGHQLLLREGPAKYRDVSPECGLAAGSLVYPRTWLLHHLGISAQDTTSDRHRALHQASELITGILYRLKDLTDLEHFVIYVERGKRWNDRLYSDFATRYYQLDKLSYSPLHLFRGNTAQQGTVAPSDIAIRSADEGAWQAISARLKAQVAAIETRAMSLDSDVISLGQFSADCEAARFERNRHAFVASVGGVDLAALIAESGDEGANIFGLMNTCRVVSLRDHGVSVATKSALLAHAQQFYRTISKRTFLVLEDDERDATALRSLGFEEVSPGMRWIAHRDVIPAWAAYLQDLLRLQSGVAAVGPGRSECA